MKDNTFKIKVDDKEIEYTIIKILLPKDMPYKYVIYTEDNKEIYASRFNIENDQVILENIENQYEFDYIDSEMEKDNNG